MYSGEVIKHEVCKKVFIKMMIMIMMIMTTMHKTLSTFSQCVSPPPPSPRKRGDFLRRYRLAPWAEEKLRRCKETSFASRTVSCC